MAGPRSWGRGSATRTSMTAGEGGAVLREGNGSAAGGGGDGGRAHVHSRSRERQRSPAGLLACPSPRGEPSRMDGEAASSMIWPRGPVSVGQTRGRTGQMACGAGDARSASQPRPFLRGPVCAWAPHCRVGCGPAGWVVKGTNSTPGTWLALGSCLSPLSFFFSFYFLVLFCFILSLKRSRVPGAFQRNYQWRRGSWGAPWWHPLFRDSRTLSAQGTWHVSGSVRHVRCLSLQVTRWPQSALTKLLL